jgi:hypothetical protein
MVGPQELNPGLANWQSLVRAAWCTDIVIFQVRRGPPALHDDARLLRGVLGGNQLSHYFYTHRNDMAENASPLVGVLEI